MEQSSRNEGRNDAPRTPEEKPEAELAALARQLAAVSREFDAIGAALSHDLRAPVRSIEGFSRLLLKSHAGQLDETGREYLGRVHAASLRLARMIEDLLKLVRLGRGTLRTEWVDLTAMARDVLGSLSTGAPERRVASKVEDGLSATGDARLLRLAMEQLLDNAWKFSRTRPGAEIIFGIRMDEGVSAFCVQDNGVGFEEKYADKLFRPFQRLHTEAEFEGTGIGLATVQRVIHAHGGRVWIRSQAGVGTRAYFSLPGMAGT